MNLPEISPQWTAEERLIAISWLGRRRIDRLRDGKVFTQQESFDLIDRIDKIASASSPFLEANRGGLFRDIDEYAKKPTS